MKKRILLYLFSFVTITLKSQNFIDTLYTLPDDTIVCQITLINNYNIFYQYKVKKNKFKETFIPRSKVVSYILNSKDVIVENQENDSDVPDQTRGFSESDGIIYSSIVEKPPKYPGGINSLYVYLEDNVKVLPRDVKVFGSNTAYVLYDLLIMSDGTIRAIIINESSIQNCGFDNKAAFLENEILKQINLASKWDPGIIEGEKVNMNIYLPLKFIVKENKIIIYPSKYLFIFSNRKKVKN